MNDINTIELNQTNNDETGLFRNRSNNTLNFNQNERNKTFGIKIVKIKGDPSQTK